MSGADDLSEQLGMLGVLDVALRDAAKHAEVAAVERRIELVHYFLHHLFGRGALPPGAQITLSYPNRSTDTPSWWSAHLAATDLHKVADRAVALDEDEEIYFGCGTRVPGIGAYRRGRTDEVTSIPGLWADVDLAAPGHAATNLPTYAQAQELLAGFGLPPTAIIHSGGGLYPWWLFDEGLWTIADEETRERAKRLLVGFQAQLIAFWNARGFHLDSTGDLVRVLRLPGTTNKKIPGNPRPVTLILHSGPRYDLAALLQRFEAAQPKKPPIKSAAPAGTHVASGEKPSLLVRAFELAKMLGPELAGGKYAVICPWESEHSSGKPLDSSTIVFPSTTDSNLGGFYCSHGHCRDAAGKCIRTFDDVMKTLPTEAATQAQAEHDKERQEELDQFLLAAFGGRGRK